MNPYTRQSNLVETQKKTIERLKILEKENEDRKNAINVLTDSLVIATKSLEEIAFIQKNHLLETETLVIVVNEINSLLNPKNDYLKYDLMNEPHN